MESEHIKLNEFENFHNYEDEIANLINQNDLSKPGGISKNFEIDHTFIDLSFTIISAKVKGINSKDDLRFDDIYWSRMMLKCEETNPEFYL